MTLRSLPRHSVTRLWPILSRRGEGGERKSKQLNNGIIQSSEFRIQNEEFVIPAPDFEKVLMKAYRDTGIQNQKNIISKKLIQLPTSVIPNIQNENDMCEESMQTSSDRSLTVFLSRFFVRDDVSRMCSKWHKTWIPVFSFVPQEKPGWCVLSFSRILLACSLHSSSLRSLLLLLWLWR